MEKFVLFAKEFIIWGPDILLQEITLKPINNFWANNFKYEDWNILSSA